MDESVQPVHEAPGLDTDQVVEPAQNEPETEPATATSVKGNPGRKRNLIVAGVAILALLGLGGGAFAAHNVQSSDSAACSKAVQTLTGADSNYDKAVADAQSAIKHAKGTGYDQTADGKQAVADLTGKASPRGTTDTSCKTKADADALTKKADGLDAAAISTAAAALTQKADAHRAAESKAAYDKALADLKAKIDAANHELADSDGKVADNTARDDLAALVAEAEKLADAKPADTDPAALDAATKSLNDESAKFDPAMKAVDDSAQKKADGDKNAADQQADNQEPAQSNQQAPAQSNQQQTQQTQQRNGSNYPQPTQPKQQAPTNPAPAQTQPPAPANPAPSSGSTWHPPVPGSNCKGDNGGITCPKKP